MLQNTELYSTSPKGAEHLPPLFKLANFRCCNWRSMRQEQREQGKRKNTQETLNGKVGELSQSRDGTQVNIMLKKKVVFFLKRNKEKKQKQLVTQ